MRRATQQTHRRNNKIDQQQHTMIAEHHLQRKKRGLAMKCYNCGKSGHLSKNCDAPKRVFTCYLCKRTDHVASRCPQNDKTRDSKNDTQSNVHVEEVKLISQFSENETSKKFVREVRIGSNSLGAIIDMEASVCTMQAPVVLREGFKVKNVRSVLEGLGENKVESVGIVKESVVVDDLKRDFRTTVY